MIMFNENQATAIAESERSDQRNGGIHISFSCKNEAIIYVISFTHESSYWPWKNLLTRVMKSGWVSSKARVKTFPDGFSGLSIDISPFAFPW